MPRRQRHSSLRRSGSSLPPAVIPLVLAVNHHLLDLGDRLRRIEVLRTGLGAIHYGVAPIQPEWVFEIIEPLARGLVAAVDDPAIGRKQGRGAQVSIAVPPVAGAGGRAAGTQ